MTVKYEILVILLHYWKAKKSAVESYRLICEIEGPDVLNERTARRYFQKFENGQTDLRRQEGSGRPTVIENSTLKEVIECDPNKSTRELSYDLQCSQSTITRHLHEIGKVKRKSNEIPHFLTYDQMKRRKDICQKLIEKPHDDRYLRQIVTTDEKWIYFRNPDKSCQWVDRGSRAEPHPKRGQFEKKVMLSIFWNYEGVILFDLLPHGQTINSEYYCDLLERMYAVLRERYPAIVNRKRVILQQDNARPHTSKMTMDKIKNLDGIEILPHPPYSPDLAPSDYYLFRSMAHFLRGRQFKDVEDVKIGVQAFIDSKPKGWFRQGLDELAKRWVQTIDHDGLYFEY
jgi:[histone H3]-lysine36 N-dimethyltransferase SETMAR